MQGVVDHGTGVGAKVPGVVICGKTGTVENYFRGEKQPNHSFFCGFAPRDNPKIAIMCVVENSGKFGGTFAAPITGLMIEKYLTDSLAGDVRKKKADDLSKMNLIPPRIYAAMRTQDSMMHKKDSAYLVAKGYIRLVKDTLGLDENDSNEELEKLDTNKQLSKGLPLPPEKDTNNVNKPDAILPQEPKKPAVIDTMGRN